MVAPVDVGDADDSIDSGYRYLGYLGRLRNLVMTSSRYVAYTSDVGEAFRPVVPPWLVTASYGISLAYVAGDVGHEAYKSNAAGDPQDIVVRTAVQRTTFQGLASLALPAFTIHGVVAAVSRVVKRYPSASVMFPMLRLAPTGAGLLVVPLLPYLFDHPVESIVETAFDSVWPVEELKAHHHHHHHHPKQQ